MDCSREGSANLVRRNVEAVGSLPLEVDVPEAHTPALHTVERVWCAQIIGVHTPITDLADTGGKMQSAGDVLELRPGIGLAEIGDAAAVGIERANSGGGLFGSRDCLTIFIANRAVTNDDRIASNLGIFTTIDGIRH